MGIGNHIFYWLGILFGLFGSIIFWVYVWEMDNWYPIVGTLIASHGGLAGFIIHYIGRWNREKE